jgi:hypothetical protein
MALPPQPMSQGGFSLSDILTTFKNNVLAISNLAAYIQSIYNNVPTLQLSSGAATTGVSTLYTASSGAKSHVNSINICNASSSAATFSIYIVPAGGTAGTGNAVFYNCSIPANTTTLWTGTLVIPASGTIQASASATTVIFMLAGGNAV